MKAAITVVAFVVGTFVVLDTGIAIKCFVCNSYHQHDCSDWFDNVTQHLTQCTPDQPVCRKVVQEAYFDGKWDVRYIRQCAKYGEVGPDEGRVCKERYGTYRVHMRYCHCDNQDGCNGGATITPNTPFIMTIVVTFCWFVLPRL